MNGHASSCMHHPPPFIRSGPLQNAGFPLTWSRSSLSRQIRWQIPRHTRRPTPMYMAEVNEGMPQEQFHHHQ